MNLSTRAQELLALQRAKYMQSLPGKKALFERCWGEIQQHGWTPDLVSRLKTKVHRLSGSAGSYGLDSLGEAANKLDLLLGDEKDIPDLDIESGSDVGRLMNALLHELEQVIGPQG